MDIFSPTRLFFLLAGIAAGGLAAWAMLRIKGKSVADTNATAIETELNLTKRQKDLLESQLREKDQQLSDLKSENAVLQAQKQEIEKARETMGNHFKALAQETLQANSQNFLTQAQEKLKQLQADSGHDLEKRQKAIHDLVQPIQKTLGDMNQRVENLDKTHGSLAGQLRAMGEDQRYLRQETANLVQALRAPATRGRWGEMQLQRTLEAVGMVQGTHFDIQPHQTSHASGDESPQRPDVIVHLPGGKVIVIDAKTPIEAYLHSLKDGIGPEEREESLARHARHVRTHIKQLASKEYWRRFETSPEFVVMFLPGESLFAAALEADPSLIDDAAQRGIILASPTTLAGLLHIVAHGWRQEDLARNAREIAGLGADLYKRIAAFTDHMSKMGRGLNMALNSYNDAVGSLERSVLPGARKFRDLKAASSQAKELEAPQSIDSGPRALQITEETENDPDSRYDAAG